MEELNQNKSRRPNIMLLVVGILYVVLSPFDILAGLTLIATTNFWLPSHGGEAMRTVWTMSYTATAVLGAYGVLLGILAIVKHSKPTEGRVLFTLGAVYVFVIVATQALRMYFGVFDYLGMGGFFPITLLFSIALPILYMIAANKNKGDD